MPIPEPNSFLRRAFDKSMLLGSTGKALIAFLFLALIFSAYA